MARPKLFTIAPHAPFLPTLVARIADGTLPGPAASPFGFADLTILVPTRRARTALANAFLDAFGPALLLPDIRALGDTDAAELPFLPPYEAEGLPHPVGASERRLVLASLVAKWAETAERAAADASGFTSPPSPGEILSLAESLGTLIDACHTEGVPAARFRELAKDTELSAHWQRSLDFLDIALRFWPLHLAESGSADAAEVRDKALDRLTAAVPALFGSRPVIAAGSTGSVPATARLMAAIARLPNGALVLPGLDTDLDGVAHETLINAPRRHTVTRNMALRACSNISAPALARWRNWPERRPRARHWCGGPWRCRIGRAPGRQVARRKMPAWRLTASACSPRATRMRKRAPSRFVPATPCGPGNPSASSPRTARLPAVSAPSCGASVLWSTTQPARRFSSRGSAA